MLYTQPQGPAVVDRTGNGSRLALAVIPAIAPRNLANNVAGAIGGAAPVGNFVTADQYGLDLMIHPSGGTSGFGGIRFNADTASGSNDWTLIWAGRPQNYSTTNGPLMVRGADFAGNGWNLFLTYENGPVSGSGSGNLVAKCVDGSPAAFSATISGLAMANDQHERVALVKRGNTIKVFNWRTRQVVSASAGNGALRTSTAGIGLGFNTVTATSTAGHNKVNTALAYNIGLPDSEVWATLDNPWLDFEPDGAILRAGGGPQSLTVTPTGGLAFSGAANVIRSASKQASGGLTFAGAATVRRGVLRAVSGGITLSGTAAQRRGAVRAPAGGVVFAGTAPYVPTTSSQSRVVTPTGGIVFAGTAPTVRKIRYVPTGGITFGGAAGYTNSGVVAALYAITRRRARPRVFPTQ